MMEQKPSDWNDWIARALDDRDIAPAELPDIDLYMDQIITLFESRMGGNRRRPEDKLLTKTMINNYSKEGLLQPIKGKKYSRDHILQMLMIYNLKQTLSIQDIKALFGALDSQTPLAGLYTSFLELKGELRDGLPESLERLCASPRFDGFSENDRRILLVLALSAAGNYFKRLSEQIIDQCF
ncbi:DUF1836 domain-containing protein [Ligaoa zhengdingensis]